MKTSEILVLALAGCGLSAASLSAQRAPELTVLPARPAAAERVDRSDSDRLAAARLKAARIKAARIKQARADAANDDDRRRHVRPETRPDVRALPVRPAVTAAPSRPAVTLARPAPLAGRPGR